MSPRLRNHSVRRRMALMLALTSLALGRLPANLPEVVVVSPNWDGIKEETARAFSDWHEKKYGTRAIVRWRDVGGTTQILRFLHAEFKTSSETGIDVLFGGGLDPFVELKKDRLLTPVTLPPEILAQIPPSNNGVDLRDPDGQWFGYTLSGFGILTNERAREAAGLPEVKEWSDLADPRLAGWISGCDPRASGSVLAIYEIMLQAQGWNQGWAILLAMSANARNFVPSAAGSVVEVGTGDAAYGVAIDSYGQAQASYYGDQNVKFILPEGQTTITPDSIAVLKNPPHPELAQHFVEFVLSREGQLLWMLPKGAPGGATHSVINRMSVYPALYDELAATTPILTNPFKIHTGFVYDKKLGSKRRSILSVLMAACMIDTHDQLVRAWTALHSPAAQRLPPEELAQLTTQLFTPPCTQEELLHLVDTDWNDPIKRTGIVNRWQDEALRRYAEITDRIAQAPPKS